MGWFRVTLVGDVCNKVQNLQAKKTRDVFWLVSAGVCWSAGVVEREREMAEIDSKKLKGELKEWESSFRVKNNGSNPTKDDIKLNPAIGESTATNPLPLHPTLISPLSS